jgi:hypothetical protein
MRSGLFYMFFKVDSFYFYAFKTYFCFTAKDLDDKNEEIRKLHEEWLCNASKSHEESGCAKSLKEALLKNEVKSLEMYVTTLHADMESLNKEQDLLQQRVRCQNMEFTF